LDYGIISVGIFKEQMLMMGISGLQAELNRLLIFRIVLFKTKRYHSASGKRFTR